VTRRPRLPPNGSNLPMLWTWSRFFDRAFNRPKENQKPRSPRQRRNPKRKRRPGRRRPPEHAARMHGFCASKSSPLVRCYRRPKNSWRPSTAGAAPDFPLNRTPMPSDVLQSKRSGLPSRSSGPRSMQRDEEVAAAARGCRIVPACALLVSKSRGGMNAAAASMLPS
jgi:hypothetical protein